VVTRLRALALALTLAIAVEAGTSPAAPADATTVQVVQQYAINATLDVAAGTLDAVETLNLSVIPRALGYLAISARRG
jgi:hypothetical protein